MRTALFFLLTFYGASLCLGAEVYPSKSVRVIVPFPPGGSSDIVARVITRQLAEQLGQSFIIDNRIDASGTPSGTVGNGIVAKSAPDGYTLMVADPSFSIVPGLYKSLPFDVAKDFSAITQIIGAPYVLVVHPSVNANTLKEFIALAHANPGKFNYGSAGVGAQNHLSAELLKIAAKINIVHIPYNGGAAAMAAVLGGQSQMLIATIPLALPHVMGGRLRALAVTTDSKRSPAMPDVPSMSEAGVSGMIIYSWFGLVGPAGMPKGIINKLHAEVVKALSVPSVKERYIAQGAELVGSSPEAFSILIPNELRRWAEVIKSAGITPQ